MSAQDKGRLVLRVAIGGLMLVHGIGKLRHGIGGIVTNAGAHGLPPAFAYGVYLGEVVGPLLVIAGLYTRPGALLIACNMVIAVWLAHAGDLFHFGRGGGYALELQALYFLGAVAIALLGAGRCSLSRGVGRWN
jgi:putative oxidoreductase